MPTIMTKTNQEEDANNGEFNTFFWLEDTEDEIRGPQLKSLSEEEFNERIAKEQKKKKDWLEVNV